MKILRFKYKGVLKTRYQYDKDLADNLLRVIGWHLKSELDSRVNITDTNTLKFNNTILNYRPFNYAITIFNFAIDGGTIEIIEKSGKIAIDYRVSSITGLVLLYVFIFFLSFLIINSDDSLSYLSLESLGFLFFPLIFIFFFRLLSLRFLNIVFDKSLKSRYRKIK